MWFVLGKVNKSGKIQRKTQKRAIIVKKPCIGWKRLGKILVLLKRVNTSGREREKKENLEVDNKVRKYNRRGETAGKMAMLKRVNTVGEKKQTNEHIEDS